MPGPAPAKVQHWAAMLSRRVQQEDITPVWNEEDADWTITITEEIECFEMVHCLLDKDHDHAHGAKFTPCEGGHAARIVMRFRRGGYRQGLRAWKTRSTVRVDDSIEMPINGSEIMSLLAKPTNPQGDGKASAEAPGSTKQQMRVKRTTVIRV